jgi:hypothetical protein
MLPVLAMFAATGIRRTDGLGYNQRYFLELVPLAAVAFAWALDRLRPAWAAAAASAVIAFATGRILFSIPSPAAWRILPILYVPLLVALLLAVVWVLQGRRDGRAAVAVWILAGIALGWSVAAHWNDDLVASRARRARNATVTRYYDRMLPTAPERSAVVCYWGLKNGAGPLLFERDLVVVEARADEGATLVPLIDQLVDQGRRVFVAPADFPNAMLELALAGRETRVHRIDAFVLLEVVGARQPQKRNG